VGSVERLAMGSLVMCLVSGCWIFPQRSVVNLAKFQQSAAEFNSSTSARGFLVPTSSNRKNWRLGKIGGSGTKPVILKYCLCMTYCKHLATVGEITQQES